MTFMIGKGLGLALLLGAAGCAGGTSGVGPGQELEPPSAPAPLAETPQVASPAPGCRFQGGMMFPTPDPAPIPGLCEVSNTSGDGDQWAWDRQGRVVGHTRCDYMRCYPTNLHRDALDRIDRGDSVGTVYQVLSWNGDGVPLRINVTHAHGIDTLYEATVAPDCSSITYRGRDHNGKGEFYEKPGGFRHQRYDPEGRIVEVVLGSDGAALPVRRSLYDYDPQGRLIRERLEQGGVLLLDRHHDAAGRPVAEDPGPSGAKSWSYDSQGRLLETKSRLLGVLSVETRRYEQDRLVEVLTSREERGAVRRSRERHQHDDRGNPVRTLVDRDSDGFWEEVAVTTFDDQGRPLRRERTWPGDPRGTPEVWTYRYDCPVAP